MAHGTVFCLGQASLINEFPLQGTDLDFFADAAHPMGKFLCDQSVVTDGKEANALTLANDPNSLLQLIVGH